MQRKALATAVALGLSVSLITAPSADAAQIGKSKTGTFEIKGGQHAEDTYCTVSFTDDEIRASQETFGRLSGKELVNSTVGTFERVYPELKPHRENLLRQLREIGAANTEGMATLEAIGSWAKDFEAVAPKSVPVYIVQYYLEVLLIVGNSKPDEDHSALFAFDSDQTVRVNHDLKDSPFGTVEELVSFGVPEVQAERLVREFEATELWRKIQASERAHKPYFDQARKVCAAGGNAVVAFPTIATPAKPVTSGASNPPRSQAPNAPSGAAAESNNGSSETGKIIGIVAGVLAAIGLIAAGVVAFAPQLGIQLPF